MILLLKGQFPPERITTFTGYKSDTLIHRVALALLKIVSRELKRRKKEFTDDKEKNVTLKL